jgi:mRNA-degrading endonuclease toxin of MazEF toxin-antitoxin module
MKKYMIKTPERGDIILCNFSPTSGHEQSGLRPALVLSGKDINDLNHIITICPITSSIRNNFMEVKFETKKTKGVVLTYHLRSIDYIARKVKIVDRISEEKYDEVVEKIKLIIEG